MITKKNFLLTLICIVSLNQPLFAASITTNMTVNATVSNTCEFGMVSNTSFGAIDGLFLSDTSVSNGSIEVICTTGATYSIALNPGGHQVPSGNRQMADVSATHFIQYELFSDSGQTTLWGDGTTGIGNARTGLTGTGADQTYIVYAKIPSGQPAVPSGSYNDTVTITVTF